MSSPAARWHQAPGAVSTHVFVTDNIEPQSHRGPQPLESGSAIEKWLVKQRSGGLPPDAVPAGAHPEAPAQDLTGSSERGQGPRCDDDPSRLYAYPNAFARRTLALASGGRNPAHERRAMRSGVYRDLVAATAHVRTIVLRAANLFTLAWGMLSTTSGITARWRPGPKAAPGGDLAPEPSRQAETARDPEERIWSSGEPRQRRCPAIAASAELLPRLRPGSHSILCPSDRHRLSAAGRDDCEGPRDIQAAQRRLTYAGAPTSSWRVQRDSRS
jgi:hypothetical protein